MTVASPLKVGCQTITWGQDQRRFLPAVFRGCADAGYQGVEIGFRHIQETPPAALKQMLADHGLELIGAHVGGNLQDTSQAAGERSLLDTILNYLGEIGVGRLMYSGRGFKDEAQLAQDVDAIRQAAAAARGRGVRLLYHNHDFEFAGGGRVMDALIDGGGDDLGFCIDVGWVVKGGADVLPLLERVQDRIGALHFKDFATGAGSGVRLDTVLLGEGVAPLGEAAAWAAEHLPGLWLIAEQDVAAGLPDEAIRANAAFLKRLAATVGARGGQLRWT